MFFDVGKDIEMLYALEEIAGTLKQAREHKGLSQRELAKRAGIRQYQISKIENGAVDLRLSSLIELARALDLDLKLVPRKAVPAVDNVVRSSVPKGAAGPAHKEINRTLDAIRELRRVYPDLSELAKLQNSIQTIANFQGIGEELETLRPLSKSIREIKKMAKESRRLAEAVELPSETLHELREAAITVAQLRNHLVHNMPDVPSLPRPAYSLDEDDDG